MSSKASKKRCVCCVKCDPPRTTCSCCFEICEACQEKMANHVHKFGQEIECVRSVNGDYPAAPYYHAMVAWCKCGIEQETKLVVA